MYISSLVLANSIYLSDFNAVVKQIVEIFEVVAVHGVTEIKLLCVFVKLRPSQIGRRGSRASPITV
jgi:hypothetical protein